MNNDGSQYFSSITTTSTTHSISSPIARSESTTFSGITEVVDTSTLAPESPYHFGDIVRRIKTGEEYMVLCAGELTGLGRSFVCLSRSGLRYEWWTSEIEKVA